MFRSRRDKERIAYLENLNDQKIQECKELRAKLVGMKNQPSMADLMRESLGMVVDFSEADKKTCLPPHYLDTLTTEERKNFVADMETIYTNDKFQSVVKYMINLFAFNITFKADKEQMKNNQMAVIGFRTLLREFDKMHSEFLEQKKNSDTEFDEQDLL